MPVEVRNVFSRQSGSARLCPSCFERRAGSHHCACGYDPSAPVPARPLKIGTLLDAGRFTVGRVLGDGAFSIVYLAREVDGTLVAIKEYLPHDLAGRALDGLDVLPRTARIGSPSFAEGLKSFQAEGTLLAQISHPGVVKVRHRFTENNTAYIVMPWHPGQTLAERIAETGPLPPFHAAQIGLRLLAALQGLHDSWLACVHRDVKPENIYLCNDGTVLLLDFGAATTRGQGPTQPGFDHATPGYAPREQWTTGSPESSAPAVDVYAWAAVMHMALTGTKPAGVDDPEAARARGGVGALAIPASRDALSRLLWDSVRQGLSLDPAKRSTAAALYRRLRGLVEPPSLGQWIGALALMVIIIVLVDILQGARSQAHLAAAREVEKQRLAHLAEVSEADQLLLTQQAEAREAEQRRLAQQAEAREAEQRRLAQQAEAREAQARQGMAAEAPPDVRPDSLAGNPSLPGVPPSNRGLERQELGEAQRLLTSMGLDTGGTSGQLGPRSREALRAFAIASGLPETIEFTIETLARLRQAPPTAARRTEALMVLATRANSDPSSVVRLLTAAQRLGGLTAESHLALGDAFERLGQPEAAARNWELALRLGGGSPLSSVARERLDRSASRAVSDAATTLQQARLALQRGEPQVAIGLADEVERGANPGFAYEAAVIVGDALALRFMDVQALAAYDRALRLNPNGSRSDAAAIGRTVVLSRLGRAREACAQLQDAAQRYPAMSADARTRLDDLRRSIPCDPRPQQAQPSPSPPPESPFFNLLGTVEREMTRQINQQSLILQVGENIPFGIGMATVTMSMRATIAQVADWMRRNPDLKLVAEGHATFEEAPDNATAMALTARRAEAVRAALIDAGVSPDRVGARARGTGAPFRARRVHLVVQ